MTLPTFLFAVLGALCSFLFAPTEPKSFTKGLAALTCAHQQKHFSEELLWALCQDFESEKTSTSKLLCMLGHYFQNRTGFGKPSLIDAPFGNAVFAGCSVERPPMSSVDLSDVSDLLAGRFEGFLGSFDELAPGFEWSGEAFVDTVMGAELDVLLNASTTDLPMPSFWLLKEYWASDNLALEKLYLQVAQGEMLLYLFEHEERYDRSKIDTLLESFPWGDLGTLSKLHQKYCFRRHYHYSIIDYQACAFMALPLPIAKDSVAVLAAKNIVDMWLKMGQGLFDSYIGRLQNSSLERAIFGQGFNQYDFDILLSELLPSMPSSSQADVPARSSLLRAAFPPLNCSLPAQRTLRHSVFALLFCRSRSRRLYEGLREEEVAVLSRAYEGISHILPFHHALADMYKYILDDDVCIGDFSYLNGWHFVRPRSDEQTDGGARFYNAFANLSDMSQRPVLRFLNCKLHPMDSLLLLGKMNEPSLRAIQHSGPQFYAVLNAIADTANASQRAAYDAFVTEHLPQKDFLEYSYKQPFYVLLSNETFWQLPASELLLIWLNNQDFFQLESGIQYPMDGAFLKIVLTSLTLQSIRHILRDTSALCMNKLFVLYSQLSFELYSALNTIPMVEAFLSPHLNITVYTMIHHAMLQRIWKVLVPHDEPLILALVQRLLSANVQIGFEKGLTLCDCDDILSTAFHKLSAPVIARFKLLLFSETQPEPRRFIPSLSAESKRNASYNPAPSGDAMARSLPVLFYLSLVCLYSICFAPVSL